MSWQCSTPSISRQLYANCQQIKLSSNSARHLSNSSRESAESVASQRVRARLVEACNQCKSISGAAYLKLCHMHWGCCCCFVPHTYTICTGIYSGSQPIQPASQPTNHSLVRPSVRPSGCLAIYPDRVSLQLSALYFAVHHHCHWQFRVVTMANRVAKRRQG